MLSVSLKSFDQRQSIGDLIGRAIRIYRQNWLLIIQILIVPCAAATTGKIGLQWGLNQCTEFSHVAIGGFAIFAGFAMSLWFLWVLTLRQIALIRLFVNLDDTFAEADKAIQRRRGQIFAVIVLGYVMVLATVGFWTILIIASAILVKDAHVHLGLGLTGIGFGFLGMLCAAVIIGVFTPLTFAISAVEEMTVGKLIKSGFALTFSQFLRNFFFHSLLLISISALVLPLSVPMLIILSFLEFFKHGIAPPIIGEISRFSLIAIVVIQVWESLVYMIIWPIFFLSFGMLYLDLKARLEGEDIRQKLKSLT